MIVPTPTLPILFMKIRHTINEIVTIDISKPIFTFENAIPLTSDTACKGHNICRHIPKDTERYEHRTEQHHT